MLCKIPVEILYEIVKLIDIKSIIPLSKTSIYLYHFYKQNDKNILYECLKSVTGIIKNRPVHKFHINELKKMCLIETNKYRIVLPIFDILLLDSNYSVHVLSSDKMQNLEWFKYEYYYNTELLDFYYKMDNLQTNKLIKPYTEFIDSYIFEPNNKGYYIDTINENIVYTHISNLNHISQITIGWYDTFILTPNNNVYKIDKNIDKNIDIVANKVDELNNIIHICTDAEHTLALTKDGYVYSHGQNTFGQLGLGDNSNRKVFTKITSLFDVIQISVGSYHSLTLTKNNQLFVFGRNNSGQLGLGHNNHINNPTLLQTNYKIVKIAAYGRLSLILDDKGNIYSFGSGCNIPILNTDIINVINISDTGYHSLYFN